MRWDLALDDEGPDAATEAGADGRRSPDRPRALERLLAAGRRLRGAAVDLLYPPSCMGCGCLVAEPRALCARCWAGFPAIDRPFCERLGTPFALDIGGTLLSPAAIADPPVFGRARAVARFDGTARELVHRLKYGDRLDLAWPMGRWMARAGAELLCEADALVPVPLHRWRLWRRRFNQAGALARAVAEASAVPAQTSLLVRRRGTRSQVGLTRTERARNLQGAFVVPEPQRALVAGRALVLVDDVMTTGSTANAAARALLRAGARSVDVLAFAVVADPP